MGRSEEGSGREQHVPRRIVRTRAYPLNENLDEYEVILRGDGNYTGPVHIEAIGDNSAGDSIPLGAASSNGQQLQVDGGRIDNVKLTADAPTRLKIRLRTQGKYSLRAFVS